MLLKVFFICIIILESLELDENLNYSYQLEAPNGPANWANLIGSKCGGKRQSPIDIIESQVVANAELDHVMFHKEITGTRSDTIKNTGSTILVKMDGLIRTISGSGLQNNYTLLQLHMHWANNSLSGSEHRINGKDFPLELHFVHWNSEKYATLHDAIYEADGLAVLGVLAKVKNNLKKKQKLSPGLEKIAEFFEFIKKPGSEFDIADFSFASLFPKRKDFYRYEGSLTTPNCLESVVWTVFKNPIYISEKSMERMRSLDLYFKKFTTNSRPPQPLNGRQVSSCCDSVAGKMGNILV